MDKIETSGSYPSNKFVVTGLISKKDWKRDEQTQKMKEAVLKVGRAFFDDEDLELDDFTNPFNPIKEMSGTNEDKENPIYAEYPGGFQFKVKSEFKPGGFHLPAKQGEAPKQMTEKEIEAIKGGDYLYLGLSVYAYTQSGGGVTMGLQNFMFAAVGDPLGTSGSGAGDLYDDIEYVEPEDAEDAEEDEEEEEKPKKKSAPAKKATKKVVEEEDDEEDEEEEEKPKKKPVKKSSKKVVEEEDDEDEEEEDEKPKKKSKPVKKSSKKVVEEEDEEDDEEFDFE